jgi:hypothetical protein
LLCSSSFFSYQASFERNLISYGGTHSVKFQQRYVKRHGFSPLTQISEVIGPEEREILFRAIANGSVVPWHHSNLLGGYDFSGEKAPGFARDQAPKISGLKAI